MKKLFSLLSILFLLGTVSIQALRAPQFTEYEVKAAYIFNFTKFINWPKTTFSLSNPPFVVGIYGDDPFGLILAKIFEGRTIKGRKLVIEHYYKPEEINNCNVLFISKSVKGRIELTNVINVVQEKSILTIGDNIQEFCELGGMINFTRQYAKHRFEINNNAANRADITISQKLLSLANIIND